MDLKSYIRTVPDWPKPGIQFRDITTLILHPTALKAACDQLTEAVKPWRPTKICAVESRGFVFGAGLSERLNAGLVLVRKAGKLPHSTIRESYALEYGEATIEAHVDAIGPGDRCVIVDDLVATGGTVLAAAKLIRRLGGTVAGCAFVIDLPDLGGTRLIEADGIPTAHLLAFEGE